VVTSRPGQGVIIGPDVQVYVTKVSDGQARLAIYAPKRLRVQFAKLAKKADGGRHG
jgi:sRNA-binding carbon storage regulator CsrA